VGGMSALNAAAKAALKAHGVSQAEWARRNFSSGRWGGDACGCPDDRCIGYHHDDAGDCGCLPALLADPPAWMSVAGAARGRTA